MARRKSDRISEIEGTKKEAESFRQYSASIEAEKLILQWEKWKTEKKLLRAKIKIAESIAKREKAKSQYAEELANLSYRKKRAEVKILEKETQLTQGNSIEIDEENNPSSDPWPDAPFMNGNHPTEI